MKVYPPPNVQVVQKIVPQSKPTDRQQRSSPSPQRTDRQQRRYERRHRQSPSHDETIRPTIPKPPSTSKDHSNRHETRQNQRVKSPNYAPSQHPSVSRPISTSHEPMDSQQVPRGRRRPLPPS
jgi:hypothetical protein